LARVCTSSAANGFIHQEHLGPHRSARADGHALAHAAGQFVGPLVDRLGQADAGEHRARRGPAGPAPSRG